MSVSARSEAAALQDKSRMIKAPLWDNAGSAGRTPYGFPL
jgi:hypothetical protein